MTVLVCPRCRVSFESKPKGSKIPLMRDDCREALELLEAMDSRKLAQLRFRRPA